MIIKQITRDQYEMHLMLNAFVPELFDRFKPASPIRLHAILSNLVIRRPRWRSAACKKRITFDSRLRAKNPLNEIQCSFASLKGLADSRSPKKFLLERVIGLLGGRDE
jgi:hypothetical protein